MPWLHTLARIPALFAQNDNSAYEGGRQVGQITAYVMIGVIVLAIVMKMFKRR